MMSRWFHGACEARELAALRARDLAEAETIRLRKHLDDLSVAHQGLVTAMSMRSQQDAFSRMLSEAFEEVAGEPQFLTPAFKEREGVLDS